jgi:DNA-binding GntR family transcriptional regulator
MLDLSQSGNRRTAHEYVRDTLRMAILRGAVSGGTRLVQADIATELGVSTTPVREALRDLASEGLIDLDAHRGAVVKKFRYDELVEIHDLTKLLEPEAMRFAAEAADPKVVVAAEALADEMEAESDVGRWVELNRTFHECLVSGIGRPRLLNVLKGLRDTTAPYIGLALQHEDYRLGRANRHHRQLIAAVRTGDVAQAVELSSLHVDLTTQVLEDARHLFDSD